MLALAQQLIQQASITPDDKKCQQLIAQHLTQNGFKVHHLPFGDVSNLWATHGNAGPVFAFAGHTDVVPVGEASQWRHPPFSGDIIDGILHGRGSADMKGALAAMITAACDYVTDHPTHSGTIAFLITSDEEGNAINGTNKVMQHLEKHNVHMDYCVIGEPSSIEKAGDQIRIGRRGSLHADLIIKGIQGHVAYPEHATNAIHQVIQKLSPLLNESWDKACDVFPATTLQITSIRAGVADNVAPGECHLHLNFRFSQKSSAPSLQARCEQLLHAQGLDFTMDWQVAGHPFLTEPGTLITETQRAIKETLGIHTQLSTSGGTSDGRFIAPRGTQVIELGTTNQTIHAVNEQIEVKQLHDLQRIYRTLLQKITP
jgi:succinyl-diaminopimelate desuccinylase